MGPTAMLDIISESDSVVVNKEGEQLDCIQTDFSKSATYIDIQKNTANNANEQGAIITSNLLSPNTGSDEDSLSVGKKGIPTNESNKNDTEEICIKPCSIQT